MSTTRLSTLFALWCTLCVALKPASQPRPQALKTGTSVSRRDWAAVALGASFAVPSAAASTHHVQESCVLRPND